MEGDTEVRRRIGLLDGAPPGATTDPDRSGLSDLITLVRVMGGITNTYYVGLYDNIPRGRAEELDSIVAENQLVQRLPETSGVQLWTGVSSSKLAPSRLEGSPAEATFRSAIETSEPAVKPTTFGLYTSTRVQEPEVSAWRLYLETYGGSLFPKPWRTYELTVTRGARIYEIPNAQAWVELVQRYPVTRADLVYPDWKEISHTYDGVRLTWPAIIAIQGIRLAIGEQFIADGYWDAETTLWLNWPFTGVHPIQA